MAGLAAGRGRRLRLPLGLALLGLLLGAAVGATTASGAQAATSRTVTFTPTQVGYASAELGNAARGQYRWLGQPPQPAGAPAPDTYYRDQVRWGAIEPTAGTYDFSAFDAGLADAASHQGKFGFRVMAWCPGCWTEAEGRVHTTPSWLPLQKGTAIPAWNNPVFIARWTALLKALGDRYRDDPRLGSVDVGGYGMYGEWHIDGQGAAATPATMGKIIKAVHDNFPHQHVVINAMNTEAVKQALALSPTIGLRMDCLGLSDFFYPFDHSAAVRNRWRTAPVLSEWCHTPSASTVTATGQVTKYHVSTVSSGNSYKTYQQMSTKQRAGWRAAVKHSGFRYQLRSLTLPKQVRSGHSFAVRTTFVNQGSAPTYDDWRVELRLVDSQGHVVTPKRMRIDLRTLLAGSRTFSRNLTLQAPPGTYRLGVAVLDPTGYLDPMRLATKGRSSNGTYLLGSVRVTR
jgi:hypothetical protein